MSDNTVTKSVLLNAFKEFRKQVREDTKDIVHDELTEFYAGRIQPEIDKLQTEMNNRFEQVDTHFSEVKSAFKKVNTLFDKLETNVSFINDNIEGLKSDLSSKVSREELDPIKTRIRRLEIAKGDI